MLRFSSLVFGLGLMGIYMAVIPIFFYHPIPKCQVNYGGNQSFETLNCSEIQACEIIAQGKQTQFDKNYSNKDHKINYYEQLNGNIYQIEYISEYKNLMNISIEFGLQCEKKIQEANIMFFAMVGRILGSVLGLVVQVPKKYQTNTFVILLLVLTSMFYSAKFVSEIWHISFLFLIWNLLLCFYYCMILPYINHSFQKEISNYGVLFLGIVWCGNTILFIFYSMFFKNWRSNMADFLAPLALFSSITLFLSKNKEYEANLYVYQEEIPVEFQVNSKQNKSFREKLLEIFYHKQRRINVATFALSFISGTAIYQISFLVMSKAEGDVYTNNLLTSNLEFLTQLFSGVLIVNFDKKKLMIFLFSLLGISGFLNFASKMSADANGELSSFGMFLSVLPIYLGKGTHEVIWTVMFTYISEIIQLEHQQVVISMNQIMSFSISSIIPFYKYLMEQLQINSFIAIGVLCFVTANQCFKIRPEAQIDFSTNDDISKQIEIPLKSLSIESEKQKYDFEK